MPEKIAQWPWQIDQVTERDVPAWLALAEEVGDLFGADMAHDPAFHAWLQRSIARGDAFCVRMGSALAGAMQFRRGSINWLAVGKRFQRRGVGRTLVAHALALGKSEVRVTTFGPGHPHPDAGAARRLYHAMGFQPSGKLAEPVSDKTPREILIWREVETKLDPL